MSGPVHKLYSIYALTLFAVLLLPALLLYVLNRLFVPYRKQIDGIYLINRMVTAVWAPLTGNRFRVQQAEKVQDVDAAIVIMNHQSLLDMFATARRLRIHGKPLIKKELLRVPILGWLFAMAAIPVDRSDRESRNRSYVRMREELEKGISLLIYPEGTRNRTNEPLSGFRDGAFRLAMDTGKVIAPVVIMNIRDKANPGSAYFRRGTVLMRYLEPVDPSAFDSAESLKHYCYRSMDAAIREHDPCFAVET